MLDVSSSPTAYVSDTLALARSGGAVDAEVVVEKVNMVGAGGGVGRVGVVRGKVGEEVVRVCVVGEGGAGGGGLGGGRGGAASEVDGGGRMVIGCPAWEVDLDVDVNVDVDIRHASDLYEIADEEAHGSQEHVEKWIVAPVWKMV